MGIKKHIDVENEYLQEMAWIFVDHFLYFFLLRILFSLAKKWQKITDKEWLETNCTHFNLHH